jgi:Tol biopolymer transport system component
VWLEKTLRIWTPEIAIRDVSPIGVAAFAPIWSADGRSLFFTSGSAGQYDPIPFFAGRQVGDRSLSVYDLASGTIRSLAHEPGYVEEGARPSRDGTKLLVLRRRTVEAVDLRSIPDAPLEVWLTDAKGEHGTSLVRIAKAGPGYYGWYPGPSEWDWSE